MSDSAKKLELLHRYAQEAGIPVDCVDTIALPLALAARSIHITPKKLKKLLDDDRVPVIDLGPRSRTILTTDFIDFLWNRRRVSGQLENIPEICPNTREQVLRALRD